MLNYANLHSRKTVLSGVITEEKREPSMLTYKGFNRSCFFDSQKGIYLSQVLNCADTIIGQGLSPQQAETFFQQCIDVYLATRHTKGLPPPTFKVIR